MTGKIFKPIFLTFLMVIFSFTCIGSELKIGEVKKNQSGKFITSIAFKLSWNNSWHNERNRDAVWIFMKYKAPLGPGTVHARPAASGHRLLKKHSAGADPQLDVSPDGIGIFIYPRVTHRGATDWTVEIALDTNAQKHPEFDAKMIDVQVYGIEMVFIPEGAFTIGEADTAAARRNFALYMSDENGGPAGLIKINSENEVIPVGKGKGQLYYNSRTVIYQGDQKGPIPATFPKGFQSFYIMKYEISQGQYAGFLDAISPSSTYSRANFGGKDYYLNRGSIRLENQKYIAGSPDRPCNFLSWDDACAYADWAGLRPMTELEFEKAARGPLTPIPKEYPWNTSSKDNLQRAVIKTDELVLLNDLAESELNDNNRDRFGASYYWVMDLAGSLWERCVTIGDSTGRSFKGTHGDGMLAPYGFASNADWPKGNTETTGFGFKGGGYYEHTMQPSEINPHSPIGYRNYGAWSGGARSIAYGSRLVRTK